jgi:hypothetical protein
MALELGQGRLHVLQRLVDVAPRNQETKTRGRSTDLRYSEPQRLQRALRETRCVKLPQVSRASYAFLLQMIMADISVVSGSKRKASSSHRGYKRAKDGLLSHRKIPAEQQTMRVERVCSDSVLLTVGSCNQNDQRSPLLRLPVEIRQQIYAWVLGGHHIQIEYKPHEHRRRQKNGQRYHEHIIGGLWHFCTPTNRSLSRPFGTDYEWGKFEWPDRYNVGLQVRSLARVSRQVHQDTSLLLFEPNLFSFANYWVMRKWLLTLKPVQRRAIRRICLPGYLPDLTKTHRKQLSGLCEVFYFGHGAIQVEVYDDFGTSTRVLTPAAPTTESHRRRLT